MVEFDIEVGTAKYPDMFKKKTKSPTSKSGVGKA